MTQDDVIANLAEVHEFRRSLSPETDRGCVLMAAAYLEDQLGTLLGRSFVDDPKIEEDLLARSRPLDSFSSRIDLAYAIGLLDVKARRDLHLIRKIRNDFAHTHRPLSFEDDAVAARCRELYYDGFAISHRARHKFCRAVMGLLAVIHSGILNAKRPTPPSTVELDQGLKDAVDQMVEEVMRQARQDADESGVAAPQAEAGTVAKKPN